MVWFELHKSGFITPFAESVTDSPDHNPPIGVADKDISPLLLQTDSGAVIVIGASC